LRRSAIIEKLPCGKVSAGVPLKRQRAGGRQARQNGLFSFLNDVAPGKSDVMQVAIGPLGQFKTLAPASRQTFRIAFELREQAKAMVICQ